ASSAPARSTARPLPAASARDNRYDTAHSPSFRGAAERRARNPYPPAWDYGFRHSAFGLGRNDGPQCPECMERCRLMKAADTIAALGSDMPALAPGHVWLAGAGPGDPGLLTLHALAGLKQADVVVHDALVDKRILALKSTHARLEFAGKRGGKPSATQADISKRLIALAKAGERVLRLKGGDPYVFGRGGEEALALAGAGVPFRVIPGVTA